MTVFLLLLFSAGITRSLARERPVEKHGQLRVEKGVLVNQHGVAPQLRGISFSWSVWGGRKYYTTEALNWLIDDFDVSLVRLSMAVEPDSGYLQQPDEQFELITRVADEAISKGIYVLIDWHDHHADQNLEAAKRFFRQISRRYAGKPNVIYEIWNEPEAIEWPVIKQYAQEIIPVIRQQDPDNVIVVGSPKWDQDVDVAAADPLTGYSNLAYSFHFYASDPNHAAKLRGKAEKAMSNGLALMVTEWGVGESDGDGAFDQERNRVWLDWMEQHQLSWANWNLTDKQETTALLMPGAGVDGGWTPEELSPAGAYIRTVLKRLNQNKASAEMKLIDGKATRRTQKLAEHLFQLSGRHILFGHQSAVSYGHGWSGDRGRSDVKDVSGSHPAVVGLDFMDLFDENNQPDAKRSERLRKDILDVYSWGGVVTMAWHMNNPITKDGFYSKPGSGSVLSDIKPGGKYQDRYQKKLHSLATFIKTLKGKDGEPIPLIFRPFHEADGNWFWWGKAHAERSDFIEVWRYTVSYLRDSLQIHNLIYAYSPDALFKTETDFLERYPGDEWVDMVGMDNYADFGREGHYDLDAAALKLSIVSSYAEKKAKLAAFTETGLESIPNENWWTQVLLKTLKENPLKLSYVLVWRNDERSATHYYAPFPGHKSSADFLRFRADDYVLFADDLTKKLYR